LLVTRGCDLSRPPYLYAVGRIRGRLNNVGRLFMTFPYRKVILLAAEIAVTNPTTFGACNDPREGWEVPRFYPAGGYSPLFATARNNG
jgi:hypothetical protein